MIIAQGYPLWVVVDHGAGAVECQPVIAWRYEDAYPELAPRPIATRGIPKTYGGYLTSQQQVDEFMRGVEAARNEGAPPERRAGEAKF